MITTQRNMTKLLLNFYWSQSKPTNNYEKIMYDLKNYKKLIYNF